MLRTTTVFRRDRLIGPKMKRGGRIRVTTGFTVQYGGSLPYRMCAINQRRHPGSLRLSALELLSLWLLAIKCHQEAPKEPFYMVSAMVSGELKSEHYQ